MKNNLLLIGLFAVGSLFLNGCNQDKDDDDDDNPQENGFTYKGTFYAAESFGIFVFIPDDYDMRVIISTGTWNENTGDLEGVGVSTISLNTVTYVDGNLLGAGDYFHSATALTPGTIYGGYESFCWNDCEENPNIVGGSLIVGKSGSEYTLTYNLTTANGETIEGYYKGELDYVTED